jgi:hypothetical protein
MVDLTLLESLKVIVFQIIEPFLPKFEMTTDKASSLIIIINKIYDDQISILNQSDLDNLKKLISENHFMKSYVKIFQDSFSKIFEDGKINNDDIPLIINLVKNIVIEVNKSNQNNSAIVKINVSTILTLVKFLMITISSFIFEKKPEIVNTILSIFYLVELTLIPISGNSFSWKCC